MLQPPDADRAHPAFGNLFVQTEWLEANAAHSRDATSAVGD